jgi:cytoskeletal protein CcmA (bactofilin family)
MLRMGKNPSEEKSPTPPTSDYSQRNYTPPPPPPYQSGETYARPDSDAAAPKALTESESIAREIKDGTLSGFVGGGTSVTGEATFKAMLRVDGRFSGRINSSSGTLVVGSGGQVDANIEVAVAMIQGTVNGDVIATQRIELGRASKLSGNIQTPSLIIEQGAVFEGTSKMIEPKSVAEKPAKIERKDGLLDASKLETVKPADAPMRRPEEPKKPDVTKVAIAS